MQFTHRAICIPENGGKMSVKCVTLNPISARIPVYGQVNTPRFIGDVGRLVAEKREENERRVDEC